MVELLVAASIGVIITSLLIMVWIALTNSWNATARGAEARDLARDAVARLSRELRDMEPRVGQATAITIADGFHVRFSTTFNVPGNLSVSVTPVTTEYAYEAGVLHWRRDPDGDGVWEVDRVVAKNLLNDPDVSAGGEPAEAVFTYTYLNSLTQRRTGSTPAPLDNILLVKVRLIVDMQPGKAPQPMDLTSTVQLRNQQ